MNIKFYVLFFACLFLHSTTSSQYVNYIDDTGWNLGLNSGGTWQEKELVMIENDTNYAQPFSQLSGGFTFGKTVAYFPGNRFFALDLRFRYLRGVNYGWTTALDSIHNLNPKSDHRFTCFLYFLLFPCIFLYDSYRIVFLYSHKFSQMFLMVSYMLS